jgi:hypothetical protein
MLFGACVAAGPAARPDDTPLPDAAAIVAKFNARDEGEHVRRIVTMTLRDKHGRERVRQALSCRKFYGTDKRTVFFFLSPATIRGTGFLTFDYGDSARTDDQWLYLPNARKARRIDSGDRGDFFVGTDFTYEDIKKETKVSTEDFDFKLLGMEVLDGHRCFKIEATPVNVGVAKALGYARVLHWFDAESLMSHKSEFLDAKGTVLRRILTSEIAQIDGIWTARRMVARNEMTAHTTEFEFTEIDYKTPVDDSMFTEEALLRGPRRH